MSLLREKAHQIIENISEKKIAEAVDYLEYLKIKEEVAATNEILADKKLLDSIQKGLAQADFNNLVELADVIENV